MIFGMIAMLIIGILIGVNTKISNENKELEAFEELITIYEADQAELKWEVNYYRNGMTKTLEENVELKKKLNKGKSTC